MKLTKIQKQIVRRAKQLRLQGESIRQDGFSLRSMGCWQAGNREWLIGTSLITKAEDLLRPLSITREELFAFNG
jgi:hypothetical protein